MKDINKDFNSVNNDFSGIRTMRKNSQELVSFYQNSSIRIWYNDQFANFESHWHTSIEIIVPVENWYEAVIQEETYHLKPGDILIIPSGELHALSAPEKGERFIYLMDISPIVKIHGFACIQSVIDKPLLITKNTCPLIYDDVHSILLQMQNEYFNKNEFAELTIFSLLLNLFVRLGINHLNNTNLLPGARPHKQGAYDSRFIDAIDYIDAHYMEDIDLEDAASTIGFSKCYFSRLFKQYTDYSFSAYICHRRIKAAEEMLEQTDLAVTEIALQSGFSSISTFNRVFRQQKNCSPSEYREKNRYHFRIPQSKSQGTANAHASQ